MDTRRLDAALDTLEALANRLDRGELVKNATLGRAVATVRELVYAGPRRNDWQATVSSTSSAAVRQVIDDMQWALESLERREAGAAGAFVISARACIATLRREMDRG